MTTIDTTGSWSLGTLLGFPVAALIALILLIFALAAWRIRREPDDYGRTATSEWTAFSLIAGVLGVAMVVLILVPGVGGMLLPSEYHQWRDVSGPVTKVDKRLLASTDGPSDRYLVTFAGGAQRACDDTRCSSVRPGDTLTLACKREWQYASTSGYGCRFRELATR